MPAVGHWYDDRSGDDTGEWRDICVRMTDLASTCLAWETTCWEQFAQFVKETALDQEVYGEAIAADPDLLGPMWASFAAAWDRRGASPDG